MSTPQKVTFTQARTGQAVTGTVISTHIQTGEVLVQRDDGSREYVKPSSIRNREGN